MDEDSDEFYDVEVYGSYISPVGLVSIGTMRNAIAYATTTAGGDTTTKTYMGVGLYGKF